MEQAIEAGETTKFPEVPIYPSSSLRGRLRRFISLIVKTVLAEKGEKPSIDLSHVLDCGCVTASPDSAALTLAEADAAAKHPVMGLIGGGPRMIPSALEVGIGWAHTRESVRAGFIEGVDPGAADNYEPAWKFLRISHSVRNDDVTGNKMVNIAKFIKNADQEIADWHDFLSEKKSTDTNRAIRSWNAHEIVIPGTRFTSSLYVDDLYCPTASIGLLFEALEMFAREQRVGSMVRNGYGRFTTEVTVNGLPLFEEGTANINRNIPEIDEIMKEWDEAKKNLDVAELEKFAKPEKNWRDQLLKNGGGETDEEKKAKKEKKDKKSKGEEGEGNSETVTA